MRQLRPPPPSRPSPSGRGRRFDPVSGPRLSPPPPCSPLKTSWSPSPRTSFRVRDEFWPWITSYGAGAPGMSDLRRAMDRGFALLKVVMGAIFALSSRAQGRRSRLDKSMITSRVRGQWYRRVREHGKWSWLSAARLHKGFTKLIWKGISDSLVQVNNYTRDKFIQRTRKISFSVCKFEMKTTIKIF